MVRSRSPLLRRPDPRKAGQQHELIRALSAPAATSGHPNGPKPSSQPDRSGAAAEARLRGTDVTLAAPGRSSGRATAITYEERVGTSICDSRLRDASKAKATQAFPANGTRMMPKRLYSHTGKSECSTAAGDCLPRHAQAAAGRVD